MRHRMRRVEGPGTEASLKWFRQHARAPPQADPSADPSIPTRLSTGVLPSPATLEPSLPTRLTPGVAPSPSTGLEQHSVPTLVHPPGSPSEMTRLTPAGEPHSIPTRVHSRTPGMTRPSPADQQSPTEVFSAQHATGTPTGKRGRGFGAPPTPEGRLVPAQGQAPGTPTYSPTEFFAEPGTPQDGILRRALKRAAAARGGSVEREGMSSPTYFEEASQMNLPP